jgi:hypothetical protein
MALGRQGDHSAATLQQGKRRTKSTRRFVPVAVTNLLESGPSALFAGILASKADNQAGADDSRGLGFR